MRNNRLISLLGLTLAALARVAAAQVTGVVADAPPR